MVWNSVAWAHAFFAWRQIPCYTKEILGPGTRTARILKHPERPYETGDSLSLAVIQVEACFTAIVYVAQCVYCLLYLSNILI